MGQLMSLLGLLYIRDCDVKKVVDDLSLFPPYPQYYKIDKENDRIIGTYGIDSTEIPIPQCISIRYVLASNDLSVCLMHYKSRSSKQVIIFSHGNAVDMGCCIHNMLVMGYYLDMDIIIYDYEGYGRSDGIAKCDSLTRDLSAVYDYARQFFNGNDIFLVGESIGSVPTCALASSLFKAYEQSKTLGVKQPVPVKGVILHAALYSGASTIPGSCLIRKYDPYDNASHISNIKCPIFHIHGKEDEIIPFSKGQKLYEISQSKYAPWWVEGGSHNNLISMQEEEYKRRVSDFVDYCNNVEYAV